MSDVPNTNAPVPAFWTAGFASAHPADATAKQQSAVRPLASVRHPQAFGSYFTYGAAIEILGLDPRALLVDGSLRLAPGYSDFGYMRSHLGPPASAMAALAAGLTPEEVSAYPPDLSQELRERVALQKFGRPRGDNFDVLGTEGAQGAIGYAFLSFLDPGDEVLITDPGYMHFASGPPLAGAHTRSIRLRPANSYRLDPDEVAAHITPRTKMLVVCDPVNPLGSIQTREELLAIARICERQGVLILNNTTHATHRINPDAAHTPIASLHGETNVDHVISVCGLSKGYALASLRLGFMAGHPRLLRTAAHVRTEITGIHVHPYAQRAALAALADEAYVTQSTTVLRRNLRHLSETLAQVGTVAFVTRPDYGFSTCLDVSATGVSAQELTVALFEQGICVLAGDAFGETGATSYLRLNYSSPDIADFERLRERLPIAVRHAQSGKYLQGVRDFYASKTTPRAAWILGNLRPAVTSQKTGLSAHPDAAKPSVGHARPPAVHPPASLTPAGSRALPPSFVSQLDLEFGPIDVLADFFNKAYAAARSYGVHLTFGSYERLLEVNLANQASWRAIIPTFDPRLSNLDPSEAFCLLGYNDKGDVVATQACRLFRWTDKSFFDAAADLSLYYAHPERDKQPGESCEITAEKARAIRGRVAFSGGGWYRPDYRGKVLSLILPRISRAYAFTRWSTDYTASMFQDSVLAGGMAERCGYKNIDWHVHNKKSPMGDIKFAFVWMEADEMLADLRTFDNLVDPKVDARVSDRRA